MRQSRPFTDQRMAERLGTRFFPATAQLQLASTTQNSVGEEVKTWVTMHQAPCRFAAGTTVQPKGNTESGAQVIFATHKAILVGYFPDVRPDTWRALIDGVAYDIKSVSWGEAQFTEIEMNMQSPEPASVNG